MSGLTPARLLAPLALIVAVIALIAVVTSGGNDEPAATQEAAPTATATATATATSRRRARAKADDTKTYTVKPGDSPSTIAAAEGVTVEALLKANPDANPTALSVGDELEVPEG